MVTVVPDSKGRIHGMDGSIAIGGLTWLTGVSYRVNFSRPLVDASVFGDKWQLNLAGLPSAEGSFEGLYSASNDIALGASLLGRVMVTVYSYGGNAVASGMAYVFAGVSSAVNDAVRVSGTFKGSGEWSIQGQYLP